MAKAIGGPIAGFALGAPVGAPVGFVISVLVTWWGWLMLGGAMGMLASILIFASIAASEESVQLVDAIVGSILPGSILCALVMWGVNSWGLGLNAVYTLEWGVSAFLGVLIGGALTFTAVSTVVGISERIQPSKA